MDKICSLCLAKKDVSLFYKKKRGVFCVQEICKICFKEKYKRSPTTRESRRNYYWKNRDRVRLQQKNLYQLESPEQRAARRLATSKWVKSNPGMVASYNSSRRSAKNCAIPKWANKFYISEIYSLARLRTEKLGTKHVVDHIIPLRSGLVCGLHAEANLQIVGVEYNASKANRYWPDMPN